MLEAKSIYLGGDIVSAQECNYESYLTLGLKCPFCNSAVFLRAASSRFIQGIQKPITAYFAHFPNGTNDDWDCVARAKSTAGKQEIERIKAEAREQRLKIYNNKLWELMKTSLPINSQEMKAVRKSVGEKEIESQTKIVRAEIAHNLDKLCEEIAIINASMGNKDANFMQAMRESDRAVRDVISTSSEYLGRCDRRLHTAICCEVLQFLSTKNGLWVLSKLVALSIKAYRIESKKSALNKSIPNNGIFDSYQIALVVAYSLTKTHWAEEISRIDQAVALKC